MLNEQGEKVYWAMTHAEGFCRDIFNYYKSTGEVRPGCDVDAVVKEMKPWYDNYCFSADAFFTQSKVFNSDMVI